MRSAPGRARQAANGVVRVQRTRARTDAAILLGRGLSGGCRTAHRTSRNSATIGIFNKTISQMKVQVVT